MARSIQQSIQIQQHIFSQQAIVTINSLYKMLVRKHQFSISNGSMLALQIKQNSIQIRTNFD